MDSFKFLMLLNVLTVLFLCTNTSPQVGYYTHMTGYFGDALNVNKTPTRGRIFDILKLGGGYGSAKRTWNLKRGKTALGGLTAGGGFGRAARKNRLSQIKSIKYEE